MHLVQLGCPGGILGFDLPSVRHAVLAEELGRVLVPPQSHGQELLRGPFIQVDGADKGDVHAQGPVRGGAVVADEDSVGR